MSEFVHLHLHTQYSVLDGAIKISDLADRAKQYGQKAIAMTDHGNMHGAIDFYKAARSRDIKPIIGCEAYITTGSRKDRTIRSAGGPTTHHITLLSKDLIGYRNLCKLVTLAHLEGFYFKPRIDFELLEELNEGLICLSGCLSSEFGTLAKTQNDEGSRELAKKYQAVFGERYFLEVQPHQIKEQRLVNQMAKELGQELGIPLVATNDCHYLNPDDHYAQEVLMCVSTGKLITDETRIKHEGAHLHFKSFDEMLRELPDYSEAVRNTKFIADQCNLEFDLSSYHMPEFDPPAGKTVEDCFIAQAREGLKKRIEVIRSWRKFSEEDIASYEARLEEELKVILSMGFASYFLVVSDFIRWAKDQDIPVGPGRGSAAGSLVAYSLFITEIDPIENKLFFERFLNPERISLPDIDIDFCIHGRDKVIQYVTEKYGRDKVAQIVTFGTLKAKAAIKDVGRVLGLSYAETDRIAKLIPAPRQGFDYPLSEAIKMEKRLREIAEGEGKELIELALKLEGLSRHTSTHAAGLVISDKPIVEYLPLMMDKDNQTVTQFSMSGVEAIGLVKFDFLGLKTLTVIHEAVRMIREAGLKKDFDINTLRLEDARTYSLISSGRTIGVFQLESSGITDMVVRLKPNCFEDIVAILALYRPGPLDSGMADHYINRKHKREPVSYPHQILEPILKDTYGIIVYQEQIMQIARDMAGYSYGEADLLRRAMGKKKPEEMAKQSERFVTGAISRGISEAVASEVFSQMETFARYGFNRSHSVAYALISYQTAYLKTHFPRQFMAAMMTFEMNDTDKTLKNINECKEMGIEVLPPDCNRGNVGFAVVDNKIFFGLAAIKGVGEKAVEKILSERAENGEFSSLFDFCKRVDSSLLNKRILENFAKSGAFDWTGLSRAELIARYEEVLKRAQAIKSQRDSNQIGLFDAATNPVDEVYEVNRQLLPEWPVNVRLANEKEALGFYLSGHPLEKYFHELQRFGASSIATLKDRADQSVVTVAGVVTALKLRNTKKGDRYASFVLEDMLDTIEVLVWPDIYQKTAELLASDEPVLVTAKLDVSDERVQLIANKIESAIELRDKTAKEAFLVLKTSYCSPAKLAALKSLFETHAGECPVKLVFQRLKHSETVLMLPDTIKIAPSEGLSNRVEQLFGEPVLHFR
jgi:DNA polymerase-3 subunit alpha